MSVSDVSWKVHSDAGGGKEEESRVGEGVSRGGSMIVSEISDCQERRRVVFFPEKKERKAFRWKRVWQWTVDVRMEGLIYSFPGKARRIRGFGVNQ